MTLSKKGFSLVELSIVLVILGLLVGGVMTGQNLIRAAELRSVTNEFNAYQTAVNVFQDKYFALPGDMPNATRFWGDNTAVCADVAVPDGDTCNGDGDGIMEVMGANLPGERFLFWQHLALAGLIQGDYTGIAGTGSADDHDAGINSPNTQFSGNGGWGLGYQPASYTGSATHYNRSDYGNFYLLGTVQVNNNPDSPLFTPEDAWNIDTKMDDGKPGTGSLIVRFWDNACATATANDDFDAGYNLSASSAECVLFFLDSF